MFFRFLMTAILFCTVQTAEAEGVPNKLNDCVQVAFKQIFVLTDPKKEFRAFLQYADSYWLGAKAYGGNTWKHMTPKERIVGYDLYYRVMRRKSGDKGRNNPNRVRFTVELDDRRPNPNHRGFWQLVVKRFYDGVFEQDVTIKVTGKCKLVDIGNGAGWVSQAVSIGEVEATMHKKRKSR